MAQIRSELEAEGATTGYIEKAIANHQTMRQGQYETYLERKTLATERAQMENYREQTAKMTVAREVAAQAAEWGVTVDQLMVAKNPAEMRMIALQAENAALKARITPNQSLTPGVANNTANGSDDAFLAAWGQGRLPASAENQARARKILGMK